MKILHTADIHIREQNDERWQALSEIIALAKSEKVEVLAISGDLFDSEADAGKLRVKLRDFFNDAPFKTILIPGNHDAQAYSGSIFLGDQVHIIQNPFEPVTINEVTFWGLPFEDLKSLEVLQRLQEMNARIDAGGDTQVLLFHGELLDISGVWENYGAEGKRRYLPVKLEYFQPLKWDYILAGHFHTNFAVHKIDDHRYFVYPGSPVSLTTRELGPRQANLFQTGKSPQPRQLNTPYHEAISMNLNPFDEIDLSGVIENELAKYPPQARLLITVGGFFDRQKLGMSETELYEHIRKLVNRRAAQLDFDCRDIHEVLADDLFKTFDERLEQSGVSDEEKERIRQLTIRAMMEL